MINRELIEKEAKQILNKFARELDKVKEQVEESFVERDEDRRVENEGKIEDEDFREIMFENSPNKQGEFIVAEKGKWVKR